MLRAEFPAREAASGRGVWSGSAHFSPAMVRLVSSVIDPEYMWNLLGLNKKGGNRNML